MTLTINQQATEELLSRNEAANYLGVKKSTLAVWASTKRYPLPIVKIGRLCKYRKVGIDDFIKRNTVRNEVLQ